MDGLSLLASLLCWHSGYPAVPVNEQMVKCRKDERPPLTLLLDERTGFLELYNAHSLNGDHFQMKVDEKNGDITVTIHGNSSPLLPDRE